MRRFLLLGLAALPLLGFDCGGSDPEPYGVPPGAVTLHVGGAVNEDLWCLVMATDYSLIDPAYTEFDMVLSCYRGRAEPGAMAAAFLVSPPGVGVPFGWDSTGATPVTNVDWGFAVRTIFGADGYTVDTHYASPPSGDAGTGKLTYALTAIGPVIDAASGAVVVHGTLSATVPSTTGGEAVTLSATF